MPSIKFRVIIIGLVSLLVGAQSGFSGDFFGLARDYGDKLPSRYLAERPLAGIKLKLADNFTVGAWGALYYGAQYYPRNSKFDPGEYQGWDLVPGFDCALGTIFEKVKVNAGADLYCQVRIEHNLPTREVTGAPKWETRPRGNLAFTIPYAGTGSLQWIQRLERQIQKQRKGESKTTDPVSYSRYRSTLKLSSPKFTKWQISPFALYEGFINTGGWPYYTEVELGVNFTPVKNMSIGLSDMMAFLVETNNYETHQICAYFFYTIDVSEGFASFFQAIRSVD